MNDTDYSAHVIAAQRNLKEGAKMAAQGNWHVAFVLFNLAAECAKGAADAVDAKEEGVKR